MTLLITALRPPENSLYHSRTFAPSSGLHRSPSTIWFGQQSIPEELGSISTEYFTLSHRFATEDFYYNELRSTAKSSVLYHETLDALDEINSLGRYSVPTHTSNLFAYPVSQSLIPNSTLNNELFADFEGDPSFPENIFQVFTNGFS